MQGRKTGTFPYTLIRAGYLTQSGKTATCALVTSQKNKPPSEDWNHSLLTWLT